jgi:tRNA pseudouridine32 synthase/23S rRNA pseudouridine746 synthase
MTPFKQHFSNDDFVVINKIHATNFHTEDNQPGLFEQVKSALSIDQLYPVHRLDKLTTGLVIFAKTKVIAAQFGQLFEARLMNKYYLAISNHKPKKKQGWVKGDMTKARRGAWKLLRSQENPAITQFISTSISDGLRLFLVNPHSGKTHQIRVALKSVGSPIVGDSLYSSDLPADRGYLHAYALQFTLNEQIHQFICPPSHGEYFNTDSCKSQLTQQWAAPWLLFKGK